jgi:3-phosphoshikimate 1-carboxyvinyltransferase
VTSTAPAANPGAVTPAARLRGRLRMPSDKSIAHRALIVGALSGGPTRVTLRSVGQDVLSTVSCLRALGTSVDGGDGEFVVTGRPSQDATLDCGNSGTTMRMLAGAAAGLPLRVTLDGDASLRRRPMERVASVLRAAGAEVTTSGEGRAPITVVGREALNPFAHELPVASAQVLGAAILAGLTATGETRVATPGPTRDHTERLLAWTGVPIHREGYVTTLIGPARPRPFELEVPGDPSAASAWLVAAALHPDAHLTLVGVALNPTRLALVGLLQRMGVDVATRVTDVAGPEPVGEIEVRGGRPLQPVRVRGGDVAELIDELPLVAVAMASVDEPSEVRDAGELRVKESDRVATVVAGLTAIGAEATELPDGWRVRRGRRPKAAHVVTHGDHRVAIAFAVAALAGLAEAVELDDPGCVAVSYPGFWDDLGSVAS